MWAGLLGAFVSPCPAADFSELLRRVPANANAVLLIDADAVHKSPHGTKEGWAKNHERDSLGGADGLPPGVQRLVIAGQINPSTLDADWKVGIAATRTAITPAQLAAAEGGNTDTLAGRQVVLSPRQTYFALLTPQTVGAMHPANRQSFSQWLRSTGELTPYLRTATSNTSAPIYLALDTTDVFDPPGLRAKLANAKALAGHTAELDKIAQAVAGLKGIRLSVQVAPTLTGELRLDTEGADALSPVAKALVVESLELSGNGIEDLEKWTTRTNGPAVVLSGPLTERGLRQLLSPLLSPAMTAVQNSAPSGAAGQPSTSGQPTAAASQRYYRSVHKLLNELKSQKQQTYNHLARAYQNYAQQIDELPLLGVDPELLTYGGQISVTLRNMATMGKATLNQNQVMAMQRADTPVQTSGSTTYGNAYWGYGYVPTTTTSNVSNAPQINSLIAQGSANERVMRTQTWSNIDKATAEMRRKMVTKYQVEF